MLYAMVVLLTYTLARVTKDLFNAVFCLYTVLIVGIVFNVVGSILCKHEEINYLLIICI